MSDPHARPKIEPAPVGGRRRRGVLGLLAGGMLAAGFAALGMAGALWTAVAARFMLPNTLAEPPRRFRAGFASDYPPGYVETRYRDRHGAYIVHGQYRGRQQIYALRSVCTHLGCIVSWQGAENRFKCPCHGSGFYQDGIAYEGPAPRPLERYAIAVAEDGQLEIDTSRMFQEELGQWDDPASYVAVG
jgi:cytochrome b6-f complex iron-sulfur subunit